MVESKRLITEKMFAKMEDCKTSDVKCARRDHKRTSNRADLRLRPRAG